MRCQTSSHHSGIAGEFGELLMPGAAGYILAGEAPVNASPGDVVALLRRVIARPDLPIAAREYALTSLMKLSARLPGVVPSVQARADAVCSTSHALRIATQTGPAL
jgi:hypothetical protein